MHREVIPIKKTSLTEFVQTHSPFDTQLDGMLDKKGTVDLVKLITICKELTTNQLPLAENLLQVLNTEISLRADKVLARKRRYSRWLNKFYTNENHTNKYYLERVKPKIPVQDRLDEKHRKFLSEMTQLEIILKTLLSTRSKQQAA